MFKIKQNDKVFLIIDENVSPRIKNASFAGRFNDRVVLKDDEENHHMLACADFNKRWFSDERTAKGVVRNHFRCLQLAYAETMKKTNTILESSPYLKPYQIKLLNELADKISDILTVD